MAVQRFKLRETVPGLPGEWICAVCEAPMVAPGDGTGSGEQETEMDHKDDCRYRPAGR